MNSKPLEDERRERFVQNLVKGMTQRQAYRDAFGSKAKDQTVDNQASKLFKRVEVAERYKALTSSARDKAIRISEQTAEQTTDMAAEIIDSYKRILRANPLDYVRMRKDPETGRVITAPVDNIKELDGLPIQEIYTDGSGVRIKFVSKEAAARALAEIYDVRGESETVVRIELEDLEEADV